jgi:hypothetical protein
MSINDSIVKKVKYPPECIPDSWFGAVPLLGESTAMLDLRRFQPYIVQLGEIKVSVATHPNAVIRARYDDIRIEESVGAMLDLFPNAFNLPAKDYLFYAFYGAGVVPANCPTFYNVWAFLPTIAHKIVYKIKLTAEESIIAEKLGIYDSVDKGVLPLPLSYQMEREYIVLGEETRSRSITIAVGGTSYPIETIYPRANEFIAITKIAAAPGTAAQNVTLYVDRDNDSPMATVSTLPLSLIPGGEINCFIPALTEIRLWTTATVAPGAHLFRYTVKRFKLTNLLRVRFGLVSKDEVPGELYEKVISGVL